jgi:hypothetical protein
MSTAFCKACPGNRKHTTGLYLMSSPHKYYRLDASEEPFLNLESTVSENDNVSWAFEGPTARKSCQMLKIKVPWFLRMEGGFVLYWTGSMQKNLQRSFF